MIPVQHVDTQTAKEHRSDPVYASQHFREDGVPRIGTLLGYYVGEPGAGRVACRRCADVSELLAMTLLDEQCRIDGTLSSVLAAYLDAGAGERRAV